MKIGRRILTIVGLMGVMIFFGGCYCGAFFLTALLYRHIGHSPPVWLVQVINSLLGTFTGFFLIRVCVINLNLFKHLRVKNVGIFALVAAMTKAMEQIAKGDFNIKLENNFQVNEPFDELVQSVNNMASELSLIEKMRQEFIANVSHEIQSPLTSIRGFAQALRNDELSAAEKYHYLSIIETESMRLSKLSDNLLRLASLEAENPNFHPKLYRLDKQLRNLILACEPQWTDKGIEMDVFLDEVTVKADEDLLGQVWINLIHNGIKFTPAGGRIRIELQRRADKVEVAISDTGVGIAAEDQLHVFERFFKADKSRERARGGSGLGLSIAQKIVVMHQGTIGVQSELGLGTTFTVSLPGG